MEVEDEESEEEELEEERTRLSEVPGVPSPVNDMEEEAMDKSRVESSIVILAFPSPPRNLPPVLPLPPPLPPPRHSVDEDWFIETGKERKSREAWCSSDPMAAAAT